MRYLPRHALTLAVTTTVLGLTACSSGGGTKGAFGGVDVVGPPPSGGAGFTPTIATDTSLNAAAPPTVASEAAPATYADATLSKNLALVNAAGALGAGKTGAGVAIGVLDSGVDRNNPSVKGRVAKNFVHVGSANDLSVDDKVGHGTAVASLAAGKPMSANYLKRDAAGNLVVASTSTWPGGIAQDATIVSTRIIGDERPVDDGTGQGGNEIKAGDGYGESFQAINGEMADAGARIINNSWGGLYWKDPALSTELKTAWKDFVVKRGGLIVFAAGNDGDVASLRPNPSDNAALPSMDGNDAALEKGWLTVTALDTAKPTQLTSYSQECGIAMHYCLTAPGDVVIAEKYDASGAYGLYTGGGTSFSAPQVSGAAAVVWAAYPYFNNDLVRQTLLGTAKDLGTPGVDTVFGWGLLDVSRAANGPGTFAWGDVTVNFAGNSVWRNNITGAGGLTKQGSGTLTLTAAQSYTGTTRVQEGALDVRNGLASNLLISRGARTYASGAFGQNVANSGFFLNGRDVGATVAGNYTQDASGNLGVWLGTPLKVAGTATIDGQLSLLGRKTGYTTLSREDLLVTEKGLTGKFSKVVAAPNVFLDATVGYDTTTAFLAINRINVTAAAVNLGFSPAAVDGAQRVESAMGAIDGQLAAGGQGIGQGFIDAAGSLQQVTSTAQAEHALASLGGQLHGSTAALAMESIDAGRNALDSRLNRLGHDARLSGAWQQDLHQNGTLAQGGLAGLGFNLEGGVSGFDQRLGANTVVGMAVSRTSANGWLAGLGDRTRMQQTQAQAYAAWLGNGWYANGVLGAGRFDRDAQRSLMLGELREGVATVSRGQYAFFGADAGYRTNVGALRLSPYVGVQAVSLQQGAFNEQDTYGFGLRSEGWSANTLQGHFGLRAARDWQLGRWTLGLDGRAERQLGLASSGTARASFTGLTQWMPVQSLGFGGDGMLYALGASLGSREGSEWRFDLGERRNFAGRTRSLLLNYRLAF